MGLIFQMEKFSWVFRNGWGKECVKFYMKTYFLPLSPFKLLNIKQTQKAFYKICVFLFQSKFGKPAKVWIWETAKRSIKHRRRPSLITHISPFTPSLRYSAIVRTTRLEGLLWLARPPLMSNSVVDLLSPMYQTQSEMLSDSWCSLFPPARLMTPTARKYFLTCNLDVLWWASLFSVLTFC